MRSKKRNKSKSYCLCIFFSVLQVRWHSLLAQDGREEDSASDPPCFPSLQQHQRVVSCIASGNGTSIHASSLFLQHLNLLALFPSSNFSKLFLTSEGSILQFFKIIVRNLVFWCFKHVWFLDVQVKKENVCLLHLFYYLFSFCDWTNKKFKFFFSKYFNCIWTSSSKIKKNHVFA